MVPDPLPFEQDIHELEVELARLEAAPDELGTADAIRRLRRKLTRSSESDMRI